MAEVHWAVVSAAVVRLSLRRRNMPGASPATQPATPGTPGSALDAGLRLTVLVLAVCLFTPAAWPAWAFMWLLAVAISTGLKWLTWRLAPPSRAPLGRHLGYLLAWPGLDA